MGIILFIAAVWAISLVVGFISQLINKHKVEIRDKVAHDILDSISLINMRKEFLSLNEIVLIKNVRTEEVLNFMDVNSVLPKLYFKRSNLICPSCSSKLVKKKGKYGMFLGCSDYPNCRYSRLK